MLLGNWNHWVLPTDAVLLLVPMDCVTGTGLLAAGTFNPKMKSEELSLASQCIPSWNQKCLAQRDGDPSKVITAILRYADEFQGSFSELNKQRVAYFFPKCRTTPTASLPRL